MTSLSVLRPAKLAKKGVFEVKNAFFGLKNGQKWAFLFTDQ